VGEAQAARGSSEPLVGAMQRMPRVYREFLRIVALTLLALLVYEFVVHWRAWLHGRLFPSLLLWIAFTTYWSIAGKNSAPARKAESAKSQGIHQLMTNLAIFVLFLPLPGLTRYFEPEQLRYLVWFGVAVQAAFLLMAIWARRALGRNWASAVRIGEGHELVQSGPYHMLRHPIYTAIIGMYIGSAISSGEYHALLALVMIAFAYLRKSKLEDELLSGTFGAKFEEYKKHSWALVPLVY
jgi:protein-S-isoprenylcysteine O-methyltransferase Ste14